MGGWLAIACLVFAKPLVTLVHYAITNDNASHALLIPFLVAWLLYIEGKVIFTDPAHDVAAGSLVMAGAVVSTCWAFFAETRLHSPDALTYYILAFVLTCLAGLSFILGRKTLRKGSFAFLFLFLLIPLPSYILDPVVRYLQHGSAMIASAIFDVAGVPVLRDGLTFRLSRASIEVAPECSGIRSSLALLILALLICHFSFRPLWKKAIFVAVGLFITIVKNGVRIATLTLLANYVDPGFLYGNLHREGGILFFLIGLLLLLPVYWLLKRYGNELQTASSPF